VEGNHKNIDRCHLRKNRIRGTRKREKNVKTQGKGEKMKRKLTLKGEKGQKRQIGA
jgi:hypothetical protein